MTRCGFGRFFALGYILVVLSAPFLLGDEPGAYSVLSLLAAPGTVLTLPLHNIVPGGGWGVIALIAVANGLFYGLMAHLIAGVRNRRLPSGRDESSGHVMRH
ncbi:MAG: hypothetical protein OXT72_04230 [Gammaproteobacteria bacterium]|nr:hypothetical protein [Gammaproteobacteria bacterium]MDE2875955.1 hypothetical protein [Gemmatimonadota bacterium]